MFFIIGCFVNFSEIYIVFWFFRCFIMFLISFGSWMFKEFDEMLEFCVDGVDWLKILWFMLWLIFGLDLLIVLF